MDLNDELKELIDSKKLIGEKFDFVDDLNNKVQLTCIDAKMSDNKTIYLTAIDIKQALLKSENRKILLNLQSLIKKEKTTSLIEYFPYIKVKVKMDFNVDNIFMWSDGGIIDTPEITDSYPSYFSRTWRELCKNNRRQDELAIIKLFVKYLGIAFAETFFEYYYKTTNLQQNKEKIKAKFLSYFHESSLEYSQNEIE